MPYDETSILQLDWEVSNGRILSSFEFYLNQEKLIELAEHLEFFPKKLPDEYVFEVGSERPKDRYAYYFKLMLFTIDRRGHCALQIRYNNNRELPYREIIDFCILKAEPYQVNKLGSLFRTFAKLEHDILYWSPTECYVSQLRVDK